MPPDAPPSSPGTPGRISIILPAYNEEACIRDVLEELLAVPELQEAEVVVVNDGSSDQTGSILEEMSRTVDRLKILHLEQNSGQSIAFLAGFRAASGDILVTMDADGQIHPDDIPMILREMEDAECVVGFRKDRKDTLGKRLGSKLANRVRTLILNDGITDTGCPLKAFRAQLADALFPWNGIHRFFPAFFLMQGARIKQVPVRHRPRKAGESKYTNIGRLKRTVRDLFGVRWLQSRVIPVRVKETDTNA